MTLRETEMLGKQLVKAGFYRDPNNHNIYKIGSRMEMPYFIMIRFTKAWSCWMATIYHHIDKNTVVEFAGILEVFTPESVFEEHARLKAAIEFIKI